MTKEDKINKILGKNNVRALDIREATAEILHLFNVSNSVCEKCNGVGKYWEGMGFTKCDSCYGRGCHFEENDC